MTEQQLKILEEVYETLGEHFDAAIVVVETDDPEGEKQDEPNYGTTETSAQFTGGSSRVLGMMLKASARLIQKHLSPDDEDGDDDDE